MTNYSSDSEVQAILANSGLGVAGNSLYDNTAIAAALTSIDACINVELGVTSNITEEPWLSLMKKIETDIIGMFILRARHYRENNLILDVATFWQQTPTFTYDHQRLFAKYRNSHPAVHNYNLNTGMRTY
jgi:hypothetical protein